MSQRLQVGIIGSAADLKYTKLAEKTAQELGKIIAKNNWILVFGAEKDTTSLSTITARESRKNGGLTIGVTYDKLDPIFMEDSAEVVIATGMIRGGGREMVQALSCDILIAIAGGSGTLNEIAVAYQANIPVVVFDNLGGWSQELAGMYLDNRRRYKFTAVNIDNVATTVKSLVKSREL